MNNEDFAIWSQETGPNSGRSRMRKATELVKMHEYREGEYKRVHQLRNLFLELTDACNEHCRHCGSRCGDVFADQPLSLEEYRVLIDQLASDLDRKRVYLCITGGEPLLRPDFFDIMAHAQARGFKWGMTSNGTLITPEVARRLFDTGMRTISISVDGLEETHEWFRQSPGSYERTLAGVDALVQAAQGRHVQITTCINRRNIGQLEAMYAEFGKTGVTSWRVINVEPIGRALEDPDLLLTPDELRRMMDFIVAKRHAGPMEVCFGCSHYLGLELERETRPWYFLCNAGVYTASIASNGDILSCLDIERRPELVQGNVRTDRFADVWEHRFELFRNDFRKVGKCADCDDYAYCAGDSFHTWNFDTMEPRMCPRGIFY